MSIQEELILEASRCINCKHQPCVAACPAGNHIPEMLGLVKQGKFEEASETLHQTSTLGEMCGVLCPHEALCEGHCTLSKIGKPVQIGFVEDQLALLFKDEVYLPTKKLNHRHLVVGLGPAGIANAIKMAEYGFQVDAIEKEDSLGGAINTHVPTFRYLHEHLKNYQSKLDQLGVHVQYNQVVGKDRCLTDLIEEYDTVFIASGLDLPYKVNLDIEEGITVHYAIDLLNKTKYTKKDLQTSLGQVIGIIGLGNVSTDIARTLLRAGKEVHILYRRTLKESPATKVEIKEVLEDGAVIHELLGPLSYKYEGDKKVLTCEKTRLISIPNSTRSKVEVIPDETEKFILDDLVFATGQVSSFEVFGKSDVKILNKDLDCLTNYPNVYVGGDIVNKEKRIVDAMVSGQMVASIIYNKL